MTPDIYTRDILFMNLNGVDVGDILYFCPNHCTQYRVKGGAGPSKCHVCRRNFFFVRFETYEEIERFKEIQQKGIVAEVRERL